MHELLVDLNFFLKIENLNYYKIYIINLNQYPTNKCLLNQVLERLSYLKNHLI